MFSLIVAYDANKGIGKDNKLPWHYREDLKLFKEHTINKKIVMGRKTFESIGRPLPNRFTYIVSNKTGKNGDNYAYIDDFKSFLENNKDSQEEICICGGANIYRQALPYCKKLYISKINSMYDCDTFFPYFEVKEYRQLQAIPYADFTFYEYEKC